MPTLTLAPEDVPTAILDSASLNSRQGVYFIGPFGRRINFAAQQRRALELVFALQKKDPDGLFSGDRPARVAVVGAGLSGLMASSTLHILNCIVHLFEAQAEPLAQFRSSRHRIIHPTLNAWPHVQLAGTTAFPYMNWHQGSCDKVADQVMQGWQGLPFRDQKNIDKTAYVHTHRHVTKIHSETIDGRCKHQIECVDMSLFVDEPPADLDKAPKEHHPKDVDRKDYWFDIVIMATGFGRESLVDGSDTKGYWESDDKLDIARKSSEVKRLLVSGTGDGGLSELVRFLLRPRDDGFAAADLLPDVFYKIFADPEIGVEISRLERDMLSVLSPNGDPIDEDVVKRHTDFFADLARNSASVQLKDAVEQALHPTNSVLLIGRNDGPYEIFTSPILKTIVSIVSSLQEGEERIAYKKVSSAYKLVKIEKEKERRIPVYQSDTSTNRVKKPPVQFAVTRHGPERPLSHLFNQDEIDELEQKQKFYNLLSYPLDTLDEFIEGLRDYDPDSIGFAQNHLAQSENYIRLLLRNPIVRIEYDGEAYRLDKTHLDRLKSSYHSEPHLFGVLLAAPSPEDTQDITSSDSFAPEHRTDV